MAEMSNRLILEPVINIWNGISQNAFNFLGALVLILLGYVVGLGVGYIIRIALQKLGLDSQVEKAKITQILGNLKLSSLIGEIAKWSVFIFFLSESFDNLKLSIISEKLTAFAAWLPNLIVGILILIFGLVFINILALKIEEHSEVRGTRLLVRFFKLFLIIAVTVIALKEIGLYTDMIEKASIEVIKAFAWGIAIALGIALGWGLKDEFKKESKGVVKELKDLIHH